MTKNIHPLNGSTVTPDIATNYTSRNESLTFIDGVGGSTNDVISACGRWDNFTFTDGARNLIVNDQSRSLHVVMGNSAQQITIHELSPYNHLTIDWQGGYASVTEAMSCAHALPNGDTMFTPPSHGGNLLEISGVKVTAAMLTVHA